MNTILKSLLILLMSLFISLSVFAQNIIYIGGYAGENNRPGNLYTTVSPYRGSYEDARYQIIYTKAEMNNPKSFPWTGLSMDAGDYIKGVGFWVYEKHSTQPYHGLTIKIGHTSASNFSGGWISGLQTVYTGDYTTFVGWNDHAFSPSFQWNGVDNVVMEICFDNSSWTGADYVSRTSNSAIKIARTQTDGSVGCNLTTLTLQAYKPCVRFNYADGNLPIELMSIESECVANGTILKWVSLSETNNDYYTIEKSINGIDFMPLSNIDGAGNSNQMAHYSFVDYDQSSNEAYYRLSQTDFDGTTVNLSTIYSNCNNFDFSNLEINDIYQNSMDNEVHISFNVKYQSKYTVSIVNILGQTVLEQSGTAIAGINNINLNIEEQTSSIFLVLINTNTEKVSKRFIYIAH